MLGKLIQLKKYNGEDGYLVSMEPHKDLPIEIKRAFYISGVNESGNRANHTALNSSFIFTAIHGSMRVKLSNGVNSEEYTLDNPEIALYVQEDTWIVVDKFSDESAIMLVFSDETYSACVYENDYNEYLRRRGIN